MPVQTTIEGLSPKAWISKNFERCTDELKRHLIFECSLNQYGSADLVQTIFEYMPHVRKLGK